MSYTIWIQDDAELDRRIELSETEVIIGRSAHAGIQLERSSVSRQHAKLSFDGTRWTLTDMGSRSGTRVNGNRIEQCVVGTDDEIQISRIKLRLIDESHGGPDHTTAWFAEADAPEISTLMVGPSPKVGYEQIGQLNTFGQAVLDEPSQTERMRLLCKLLVEVVAGAHWAMVLETSPGESAGKLHPLEAWPKGVLSSHDSLHLSRTAIAAVQKSGSPVLASNDAHRDGVEFSIVAGPPSAAAVCPLGQHDGMERIFYLSLPPQFATTDWLAVIALAAKEYQQAEASLRERESERERAAIQRDLDNARAIQESILPDKEPIDGIDLGWSFVPCDDVGGDLLDVVTLPDGKVMVVIADVSGHGLAAALATLSIHSVLRTCIKSGQDAEAMMTMLNEHLCDYLPPGRFVTMLVVIIDPKTGETTSINAGHHSPLVVGSNGEVRELDTGHHLILGVTPGPMPPVTDRLAADETMLLYTDGLIELNLDDGGMLRVEGLSDLLSKACSEYDAIPELVVGIRAVLDGYQAGHPVLDDQSFMLVRQG